MLSKDLLKMKLKRNERSYIEENFAVIQVRVSMHANIINYKCYQICRNCGLRITG